MKILILSPYNSKFDEGMKNFAIHIAEELSKRNEVRLLDIRRYLSHPSLWIEISSFNPDIIHVFLRPSSFSFGIGKLIKFLNLRSKIVFSALQPPIVLAFNRFIMNLLKPDIVLAQSINTDKILRGLGCKTKILSSGVDASKFKPIISSHKIFLRNKYGIQLDKFVLLHVGHINRGRNLEIFNDLKIKYPQIEIILVGSTNNFNFDKDVYYSIRESGCKVWRDYFPNIEELYQLADCYIFPTMNSSYSIDLPLSVLEALACNIPLITAKFGGIPELFNEDDDIVFLENPSEIKSKLRRFMDIDNKKINNREKILDLSWENIAKNLDQIYSDLVLR